MLILVCIWIFPFRGALWMMDTIGSDMRIYTIGYSAFDMNGYIRASIRPNPRPISRYCVNKTD